MEDGWGKSLKVSFVCGGKRDEPYVGKKGMIKIEDVITYYFPGMRKPCKSQLISQVYKQGNEIYIRTTSDDYEFKEEFN